MYLNWEKFEWPEDEMESESLRDSDIFHKISYIPGFGTFTIFDEDNDYGDDGREVGFSLYLNHVKSPERLGFYKTCEEAQDQAFVYLMKLLSALRQFHTRVYEQLKGNLDKIADELELLHVWKNEDRGVQCVRDIVTDLRRGDITMAETSAIHDGDKIRAYPDIHQYLLGVFPEYAKWRG